MNERLQVEVVYASQDKQSCIPLSMPIKSTVEEAITCSGILFLFPEIDLAVQRIGIFSQPCRLEDSIKEGDRIEIYRRLSIDPKEVRRAKAKKAIAG